MWWNTITKKNLGRKEFVWLTLLQHGSSLNEVSTETWRQELTHIMKDCYLLVCSSVLAQSLILQNPGPTYESDIFNNRLDTSTSIINWLMIDVVKGLTIPQCYGNIFSIEALFSDEFSLCQVGIKLTNMLSTFILGWSPISNPWNSQLNVYYNFV